MPARRPRDTRRIRARIFWLHDKPLSKGDQILIRLGTRESRASVVAIEKAVDPGELSNEETKAIARNHVGEIDISLAQPIAADPYQRQSAHRTAGDRGQRPHRRRRPRAVGRCRTARRPDRHRAGGIRAAPRRTLGALPPQRRGDLADRTAGLRQIDAGARAGAPAVRAGGSPILLDGDTLRAGLNGDLGFSAQDRTENIRRLAEVATHLARNGHIAIVAAVSPSADDRAAARRIADTSFREIYVATPAEVCESRDPKGHYAKARAGTLHGVHRDRQ